MCVDYGLPGLRHSGETEEEDSEEQLQRCVPKVYRAPEVRDLPPRRPSTSIPADVYSYAIILFEIATRMDPHSVRVGSGSLSLIYLNQYLGGHVAA